MKALRGTIKLALLVVLPLAAATTSAQDAADLGRQGVRELSAASGVALEARYSALTGRATFLSAPDGNGILPRDGATLPAAERAVRFLDSHGSLFGLGRESRGLVIRQSSKDALGQEHVRVQQTFRGIPVVGAELMIHLRGQAVVAANGRALPDVAVEVKPRIDANQALARVRELARKHLRLDAVTLSRPELQILNRGLLDGTRRPTHLTWFVVATAERLRQFVWVDAHRGAIVLHFNQMPQARNRTVYTASNGPTLPGTLIGNEAAPPTGDVDAGAAFDHAGDTYDYFWNHHGRDSFDGAGSEIRSTVHYCPSAANCPYENAGWSAQLQQMVYGDGYAQGDDVVAHELTHAVTDYTASLFYYMQSGALNESFSDIFGETVDLLNGRGNDDPSVRWLMGEDLPIGAIRNMMDPGEFLDPGRVSDSNFYCGGPDGNYDGGGVHYNSGVPNHAYALTVDGGTYNGFTVVGIGLEKAAAIQYRTLTTYLLSASDFLDADAAIRQACVDLTGTSGITAADCSEVGKALDAVEMAATWPCSPTQATVPALCPAGQTAVDVWFDNLETINSGQWLKTISSGPDAWGGGLGDGGIYWPYFATSGSLSFWGYNNETPSDTSVGMTAGVTLPANARLQFNHSFGFENWDEETYDGGVLEYCTGACSTWTDAGPLISAGAAYNGTVDTRYGNPLGGRAAFTRESWGYTASQLDLATLAGETLRLRYRIGTDTAVDDYGWFIDDVRVYQCVPPPPPTITSFSPESGPVGTSVGIEGTWFTGATAVTFGGTTAPVFTVDSAASITATVPAGATTGLITVTTPGGTATSATEFTVVPCTFGIDPTSEVFGEVGGGGSVAVTASHSVCTWTAVSNDPWIVVTAGTPGIGTGAVTYTVDANAGPARTGTVTIAGETFTVTQGERGYYAVTPCRAFDSRVEAFGPALEAMETRAVSMGGVCGVPPGARAVSLNVTVTGPTAAGNLRLFPAGEPMPLVSALNYVAGQTRANNAVASLGSEGEVAISCSQGAGTVHVIVDVNGYFLEP